MTYLCVDRGTEKCPCALLEAGQCYTCGMASRGRCDCTAGWQGVCPYTEYAQRGRRQAASLSLRRFTVVERKDYAPALTVVTLAAPLGFAARCRRMGRFLLVKSGEWFVPLSVMESRLGEGGGGRNELAAGSGGLNGGRVSLAVNMTGPKTEGLLKRTAVGSNWEARGPFAAGLVDAESFDPQALSIVVAKGLALMPLLNVKAQVAGSLASFYLDRRKLPPEFVRNYLGNIDCETVDLEKDMERVAKQVLADREY